MAAMIEIQGVSKSFSDISQNVTAAVEDISLKIQAGEFVCIVGPSGCGKTTLLHSIAGLKPYFPPERGAIFIEGRQVKGPGAERGVVFQEYALLPWRNVQENIEFGLKLRGVTPAERAKRSEYYIHLMGLQEFQGKFPHQLSGGMKQRVAVARALVNNPKVLLMDEPFAAVDAQTRMTLQEELNRIYEQEKNTILFVTHSVEEAVFLSTRIIVLTSRPGRVLDDLPVRIPRPRRWAEMPRDLEFQRLLTYVLSLIRKQGD
jgi:NitT/TauT family transport system ATP-binding protein